MREHHNKPRFPYKVMLYPDWSDLHSKRGEAESPMNSNYFQTQIDFYSLKLLEIRRPNNRIFSNNFIEFTCSEKDLKVDSNI